MTDTNLLFPLACGHETEFYLQNTNGLIEYTYNFKKNRYDERNIGKFYIYHIKENVDINERCYPLYTLTYLNLLTARKNTIENKTYGEMIDEIKKTKLITKDRIADFLYCSLYCMPKITIDGVPFMVKEKVDFEKEGLPMKKI